MLWSLLVPCSNLFTSCELIKYWVAGWCSNEKRKTCIYTTFTIPEKLKILARSSAVWSQPPVPCGVCMFFLLWCRFSPGFQIPSPWEAGRQWRGKAPCVYLPELVGSGGIIAGCATLLARGSKGTANVPHNVNWNMINSGIWSTMSKAAVRLRQMSSHDQVHQYNIASGLVVGEVDVIVHWNRPFAATRPCTPRCPL